MTQGFTYDFASVMPAANASGIFSSLFSAQSPSNVLGVSGAPVSSYSPIAGLVNIPCTAPPVSEARIQATEVKQLQDILSLQIKHVLLNGYYAALNGASDLGWNCVIDGTAYDIMGVEHDSQNVMTRLEVRLAEI